jgi:hypothetical protein
MSAASSLLNRRYRITARDGTNVTLTADGATSGQPALPSPVVLAHNNDTSFWGAANGPERYTLGFDKTTA